MSRDEEENLKFFGRVNASISHELKNILAIISETTGFLDDLIALSKKGQSFDMSELENSNKSILEEIERGFHTIRQMNKFAHSIDNQEAEVEIIESVELAAGLSGLAGIAKPVDVVQPEKKIWIKTNPFLFMNLIYNILYILYQAEKTDQVNVGLDTMSKEGVYLIFSGFELSEDNRSSLKILDNILGRLNMDLKIEEQSLEIKVSIPIDLICR